MVNGNILLLTGIAQHHIHYIISATKIPRWHDHHYIVIIQNQVYQQHFTA